MNQITVNELSALQTPTLLDVREPDEYTAGHAPGAVNIPLSQLTDRLNEIPTEGPVHVICQSGRRSAQASVTLTEHGIDAVNVQGGTTAWAQNGYPLETELS